MTVSRQMKVGLFLPAFETGFDGATPRWSDILDLARRAEALGFDSLWIPDHFLVHSAELAKTLSQVHDLETDFYADKAMGVWECWTLLAALASTVPRVELGTLVTCTLYRNPALLAKMADTVDEISGGRVVLGLGSGDAPLEQYRFGYSGDRPVTRFEEALTVISTLLRVGECDWAGKYYQVRECLLRPRGPRPTGPPILIGVLQNRPRMVRLTAQFADIWSGYVGPSFWNLPSAMRPFDTVTETLSALDAACRKLGRDPKTLERRVIVGVSPQGFEVPGLDDITGTPEEIANQLAVFATAGITHLEIVLGRTTPAALDAFAPVLGYLAGALPHRA